ncbi:MAG: phosphodiester glycosidase family protein [Chloroflexota bacterium]
MRGILLKVRGVLVMFILAVFMSQLAFTGPPDGPGGGSLPGFRLVATDVGAALYQNDTANDGHQFVQVVHLDRGAAIQLLHGDIVDPGQDEGVYGGDNPLISTQALADVWTTISSEHPHAFCLTNGQFYSAHTSSVRLSFPLKIDGSIVSDGFAIDQFADHQLMLELWPHKANIRPLTEAALHDSTAPHILTGLAEDADGRRPNMITGRTFIGVGQPRLDGSYTTIFIFTSRWTRKTEAAAALRRFGAEKVMMLDGGASTQLICQGDSYIGPGRYIPQTIAVLAAPLPAWSDPLYQFDMLLFCERQMLLVELPASPDWPRILWC